MSDSKIEFKHLLCVDGPQRSGIHAVCRWLMGHCSSTVYVNDTNFTIYHGTYRPQFYKDNSRTLVGETKLVSSDLLLLESENASVEGMERKFQSQEFKESIKDISFQNLKCAFVLRDPLNLFASQIRKWRKPNNDSVNAFESIYKHYKSGTKKISGVDCVFVHFNRWFRDKDYRKQISNELGLEHSDRLLNDLMSYGSGSSFSGVEKQGKAQDLNVLTRWKQMKDDPFFKSFLQQHPEYVEIAQTDFSIAFK